MDGSFPPGVADKIRAMGPRFDDTINAETRALYTPFVKDQPTGGVTVTSDVAYGSDARQKLDVYRPDARRAPVILYVPGGGYVGGDKAAGGVFYRNLGIYFARHGFLTVVMNYRLAPEHKWPAGAEDVKGAIAWARNEAEGLGGDPNRLILFGQSAGSTHSASYLFDPRFHAAPGGGVVACLLMSGGGYRVSPAPAPNQKAYFGEDASQYEDRSPLTHVGKSKVPLFLSVAEFDPGTLTAPSYELARAVSLRDGRSPQFHFFRGHNHVSTVQSLGSPQDDVGSRVREFMAAF